MVNFLKDFSEEDITYSLYGLLLGDGCYKKGWIQNLHTNKQKFYCKWLESIFIECGQKVSSKYDFTFHTTFGDYEYSRVSIKVPNKTYFENNNIFFNEEHKKIISDFVLNHINNFGLLLWFLDDGQLHVSTKNKKTKRFGYLNTQSFTYDENVQIKNMFKNRFDIDLEIHINTSYTSTEKNKKYYRLYFNAENFRKFFDLVRDYLPYIPKEFYYKFDMKYTPNRLKSSILFSELYDLNKLI